MAGATTPPPVIGKAGNLTVFITPPATPSPAATPRSKYSESPRSDPDPRIRSPCPSPVKMGPLPNQTPPPPPPAATPRSKYPESPRSEPDPRTRSPSPVKVAPLADQTPAVAAPAAQVTLPPPVQVPPSQFEKALPGKKNSGSGFGFFWDAVARVQEAHASLDEYVANWLGLDQSKYQWALDDYYENNGKETDGKAVKPKEFSSKMQSV